MDARSKSDTLRSQTGTILSDVETGEKVGDWREPVSEAAFQ